MSEKIKKITVSAITAILAASCTGCAAVTDLLQEHNIEIPYITSGWRHGEDSESGEPASAGVTGAAETANEQEPAEQLSVEELRRMSEGKNLNIYCWDESLESLFIMYYPGYEDIGDRKGRIGDVTVNWILPQEEGKYMELREWTSIWRPKRTLLFMSTATTPWMSEKKWDLRTRNWKISFLLRSRWRRQIWASSRL